MKFLAVLVWLVPALAQKTHEFCAPCHAEQVTDFQAHPHFQKGLNCDACHGSSVKHRTSTGAAPPDRVAAPDEVPALCGGCHAQQAKDYAITRHSKLVLEHAGVKAANCATCHGVHNLRTPAQIARQCERCHATVPSSCKAAPAKKAAAVSCMNCHATHTLIARGARATAAAR